MESIEQLNFHRFGLAPQSKTQARQTFGTGGHVLERANALAL
jgi:hypothetical protein